MLDPVERARHYRNRAEECLRLADIVWSHEVGDRYRAIAEHYAALAEAELVLANGFEQELKHPRSRQLRRVLELHNGSLEVLTSRTFEGAEIKTRFFWLNTRQIHLRRAFWTIWPCGNWRVFERVLGKGHATPPATGASTTEHSATDACRSLSVMFFSKKLLTNVAGQN